MSQEQSPKYELKISFDASVSDAEAFHAALAQICEAWNRHKRILNYECSITAQKSETITEL